MKTGGKLIKIVFFAFVLLLAFPFKQAFAASFTGYQVVDYAKNFLGVRYVYGGTTPNGFDCSGYTSYVYKHFGISLPRTSGGQFSTGKSVSKSSLLPGDLVFFKNTYQSGISHVGIYVGDNKFINAASSGVEIDSLSNSYWSSKYAGAKRVLSQPVGTLFKDLGDTHPALVAIKELNSEGIIKGYSNGLYHPDDEVTRGQAAAIINRALHLAAPSSASFKDVSSSNPFAKDIAAIEKAGIINGYSDGTFRPYDPMTRAQMAVIVTKAFKKNVASVSSSKPAYQDVPSSYWAFAEINTIHNIDKTTVYQTSKYRAGDETTRADFAAAIYNAK
ncbi:NlpC/P60 family protein [Bacillus smithii]|uniref:C40 family peptidase n=1 Tax=Bacillus smithii TaxID=1479 RepID=UPI002E251A92|nr:NlpC/P60 family protein [Bacillus smithii]MED1456441.1 NlpC/P60 family protein [Bacillus smithii]